MQELPKWCLRGYCILVKPITIRISESPPLVQNTLVCDAQTKVAEIRNE